MRNKLYIIILLIVAFACQEAETLTPDTSIINSSSNLRSSRTTDPVLLFENQLEWVAYLVSRAVATDAAARSDFDDAVRLHGVLGSRSVKLRLDDLLAAPNGQYGAMRDKFEELYHIYQSGADVDNCQVKTIGGSPRPVYDTGGAGDCPFANCNDDFGQYLDGILHVNCLEIYLPIGFDNQVMEVSSSAHPLTDDAHNDLYIHTRDCVSDGIIDDLNVGIVSNPLIVRPVRTTGIGCLYQQYDPINFKHFLYVD
ncbi:MAG: hypothetical protein AAFO69_01450 [Bacteroidota bacterium]